MIKTLLDQERESLNNFFDRVNVQELEAVLDRMMRCEGLLIFIGIGKSGLVAKKIALTMTSTGTRAVYLSPTEALHGDFGIVNEKDLCILLSKSGESDELNNLLPHLRNKGVTTIVMTSTPKSRLARNCDICVNLPDENEICPFNLAPTTSTVIQMIVGDILAVALMKKKNLTRDDYAKMHPGGRIGKRISMRVRDLMLTGDKIPKCLPDEKLVNTLVEQSSKQCGCLLVINPEQSLLGIFTDGDLRRAIQKQGAEALETPVYQLMTTQPRYIDPDSLVMDAMLLMESDQKRPITVLPVLDSGKVVGVIKMHDIVQSGI